jgi:hypothetical protein
MGNAQGIALAHKSANLRIPSGLTVICAQSTAADSGFNFPQADFCGSLISDELTIETDK